jgi:hypothetical protein
VLLDSACQMSGLDVLLALAEAGTLPPTIILTTLTTMNWCSQASRPERRATC